MLSLTSFIDETGHGDDPALHFAGMAGFVAPLGAWEVFEDHWNDLLEKAGLRHPFHMKEFAHSTGQFEGWKGNEGLRRLFFGRLIEIIRETKADPVGAIVSIDDFKHSLRHNRVPSAVILTTSLFRSAFGGQPRVPYLRMQTKRWRWFGLFKVSFMCERNSYGTR